MAEERSGGAATEPASERKLQQARERGDVPRSREVIAAATLLAASFAIAACWPQMLARLRELLARSMSSAASERVTPLAALDGATTVFAWTVAPVLGIACCAALVAGFAQVRGLLSLHPVKPDLGRLSPAKNLKQIFGKQAGFELIKSVVKLAGLGYVGFAALWDDAPRILSASGATPEQTLSIVGECLGDLALRLGVVVAALAAIDLLYQRRAYLHRQRMTKAEVRREHKDTEGDPQRKAERQRVHRETVDQLMLDAVADADCVIINPVRVAVALKYDAERMGAPRVVARGQRLVAARIRELARKHGVPIVRNVPLARALVELELDQEIPEELYEAVAEVLRFVYALDERRTPTQAEPPPPSPP